MRKVRAPSDRRAAASASAADGLLLLARRGGAFGFAFAADDLVRLALLASRRGGARLLVVLDHRLLDPLERVGDRRIDAAAERRRLDREVDGGEAGHRRVELAQRLGQAAGDEDDRNQADGDGDRGGEVDHGLGVACAAASPPSAPLAAATASPSVLDRRGERIERLDQRVGRLGIGELGGGRLLERVDVVVDVEVERGLDVVGEIGRGEGGVVIGGGGVEVALELIVEGRLVLQLRALHRRGGPTHLLAFERRAVLVRRRWCRRSASWRRCGTCRRADRRPNRRPSAAPAARRRTPCRSRATCVFTSPIGLASASARGAAASASSLAERSLAASAKAFSPSAARLERSATASPRSAIAAAPMSSAERCRDGGGARVGEGVGDFARPVVMDDDDRGQPGDEADADQRDAKRDVRRLAESSHEFPSAAAAISPRLCGVCVNVTSTLMSVRRRRVCPRRGSTKGVRRPPRRSRIRRAPRSGSPDGQRRLRPAAAPLRRRPDRRIANPFRAFPRPRGADPGRRRLSLARFRRRPLGRLELAAGRGGERALARRLRRRGAGGGRARRDPDGQRRRLRLRRSGGAGARSGDRAAARHRQSRQRRLHHRRLRRFGGDPRQRRLLARASRPNSPTAPS